MSPKPAPFTIASKESNASLTDKEAPCKEPGTKPTSASKAEASCAGDGERRKAIGFKKKKLKKATP